MDNRIAAGHEPRAAHDPLKLYVQPSTAGAAEGGVAAPASPKIRVQLIAKRSPIEDLAVIDKILTHLEKKAVLTEPVVLPQSRAPPQSNLFD